MKAQTTQRLQKLEASLNDLFQELSAYSDETLNTKPAPDQWSALQTMHHLLMAEGYAQRYVAKKLSFKPELNKAGFGDWWRSLLLRAYLGAPFKFKAPAAVADENLPTDTTLAETQQLWLKQRRELVDQLQSYPPELFTKSLYKHPFAGRMTLDGMLVFYQDHFDRHRKQIERTLAAVSAQVG